MTLINTFRRGVASRAPIIPVAPTPVVIVPVPITFSYPQVFSAAFSSTFA